MNIRAIATIVLVCILFSALCFSVPLWDRVYPIVLGLPFNLFWLMSWIPLSSLSLWGIYRIQGPSGVNKCFGDGDGEDK